MDFEWCASTCIDVLGISMDMLGTKANAPGRLDLLRNVLDVLRKFVDVLGTYMVALGKSTWINGTTKVGQFNCQSDALKCPEFIRNAYSHAETTEKMSKTLFSMRGGDL